MRNNVIVSFEDTQMYLCGELFNAVSYFCRLYQGIIWKTRSSITW